MLCNNGNTLIFAIAVMPGNIISLNFARKKTMKKQKIFLPAFRIALINHFKAKEADGNSDSRPPLSVCASSPCSAVNAVPFARQSTSNDAIFSLVLSHFRRRMNYNAELIQFQHALRCCRNLLFSAASDAKHPFRTLP